MPFEVLLQPLRLPLRAFSTLGEVAQAVISLQAPLESVDAKVTVLERSLTDRLDVIEAKIELMIPLLERMTNELADTTKLLPDPSDGPLARLKDTFSSS